MKSNIVKTKLWRTKHLGDVCDVEYGYTDKAISRGEYRFVRITDTDENGLLTVENRMYVNSFDEADKYILTDGDLLMARVGASAGNVLLFKGDEKSVFASYLIRLRFKKEIISKLYWYFAKSNLYWEQVKRLSAGAAQPQFNGGSLKKICITYPEDLSEQKRIVKILDEVFGEVAKAKENAEKNLKNSKELFESYLQSVFEKPSEDWSVCELNDHVKFIDYRGRTPKKTSSGIRLITAKNIKMGYLQKEPEEFIHINDYYSWMTRGIPKKGDVLFTTEAPLANVAQLDTKDKVAFAQRTIIFQADKKYFDSTFLKYLLLSRPMQERILSKATGATVQGIKASLLKKIEIAFPKSLAEQKAIVKKLDALSAETKKLEGIYAKKLADLEELKKEVLRSAFAGEF